MKGQQGFVMADAIIALLIVSVLMTALVGLTLTNAQNSRAADTRLTATLIARGLSEDPSIRQKKGSFEVNHQIFDWEIERKRSALNEDTVLQIEEIEVDVTWSVRSGQNQITYRTARWGVPNA